MNSFLIYALAVLPGKHETFRFVNIYPTPSNIMVQHPSEYLMVMFTVNRSGCPKIYRFSSPQKDGKKSTHSSTPTAQDEKNVTFSAFTLLVVGDEAFRDEFTHQL